MSYTKDLVDLRGIRNVKLLDLVDKLNCSLNYSLESPSNSIMTYGVICKCDDCFLCEHRLQYVIDWFINNP